MDLEWLEPSRVEKNLFFLMDMALSSEVSPSSFESLTRRVREGKLDLNFLVSDHLDLSPSADAYAKCAADLCFWKEIMKTNDEQSPISLLVEDALSNDKSSSFRCQHLVVLYTLFIRRSRISTAITDTMTIRFVDVVSQRFNEFTTEPSKDRSASLRGECFWLLRCLSAISIGTLRRNSQPNITWNRMWELLTKEILPYTNRNPDMILLTMCVSYSASVIASVASPRLIVTSLESLWGIGYFPAVESHQLQRSKLMPAYAANLLICSLQPDVRIDMLLENKGSNKEIDMQDDASEPDELSKLKAPSLRCELVRWAIKWALYPSPASEAESIFAQVILGLIYPKVRNSSETSTTIADDLRCKSRLSESFQEFSLSSRFRNPSRPEVHEERYCGHKLQFKQLFLRHSVFPWFVRSLSSV